MIERTLDILGQAKKMEDSFLAVAVRKAGEFESAIYISNGSKKANAKSLMGMMSMEIDPAQPIVIAADGTDEEAACEAMAEYFLSQR